MTDTTANTHIDSTTTVTTLNNAQRLKQTLGYAFALTMSLIIVYIALGVGFGEWQLPQAMDELTWQIRYPRVLTALLVGLCLSVAGSAMQALFQNPLADPSLIGTSGGAALGVVGVLALGITGVGVPLAAFVGAMAVCFLILGCHRLFGGGVVGLLILGFVISAFCGALVSLILFMSDDLILRSATNWLSGSMAEAGFVPFRYILLCMAIGLLILIPLGRRLDILMLGENTALSIGINVSRTRLFAVIGSALLTGAAVAMSGMIGFIGMMVPNILAFAFGGGRTRLMIWSGWLGSILMLTIDTTARYIAYPVDLPVGIVLALIGSPFFIWLFISASRGR